MNFKAQPIIASVVLMTLLPLLLVLMLVLVMLQSTPVFFTQLRAGKNRKPFRIFKFRTMYHGAENDQKIFRKQNEADGPVFKIYSDPRLTKTGKFLAHTGLDELPQLINIIKGEMAFVGPRPLPVEEANKVPNKYKERFSVLPGITSPWVVDGSHNMSFKRWMESDVQYAKKRSLLGDLGIGFQTFLLVIKYLRKELYRKIG